MPHERPSNFADARQRKIRRAAGVALIAAAAVGGAVSLRSGLFTRPVSAEVKGSAVAVGAADDGVIEVPAEASSVQAAIEAANSGNTVRLAAGVHSGGIRLGEKSVRLEGAGAAKTTIQGAGQGPVVHIDEQSGAEILITGLTILGGKGIAGAGVLVSAGNPEIRDVDFRGNEGSAAVVSSKGRPVFADCRFRNNRSGFAGGAVSNLGGHVLMVSCVFDTNSALTFGGAVFSDGGSVEMIACTFAENFTNGGAFGGAVYGHESRVQLTKSEFINNESRDAGGAMYLRRGSADIKNCRFVGNRAEDAWAVYSSDATARMEGSTFCGDAERLIGGSVATGPGNAFDMACFPDCNGNGISDSLEVARGWVRDLDDNGKPDECDMDCNSNGLPDAYEIATDMAADVNLNGVIDICEIRLGLSGDADHDLVPDEVPARSMRSRANDAPVANPAKRIVPKS